MIKMCKKCNIEFYSYSKWGEKQYCSRKCANSRNFSDESKLKKSLANKGKKYGPRGGLTEEQFQNKIIKYKETVRVKLLTCDFDSLGLDRKRLRVFEEQKKCCNKCKISSWIGKPIILELEHKDGNNKNNSRNNLEGLCPNCHSLTDTWRGRNKSKNKHKINNDVIIKSLLETKNIRQALIKIGLTPKGNNYIRVKKILDVLI